VTWLYGSSPRVRGTQAGAGPVEPCARFIPACAGNTPSSCALLVRPLVHPRVCGEHNFREQEAWGYFGSSPRVRGTHRMRRRHIHQARFIPACAGNTRGRIPCRCARSVHPRVCGEHSSWPTRCRPTCGSSPRVRGTPVEAKPDHSLTRFIPACAGNTGTRRGRASHNSVHPRVCGEHSWLR